MYEPWSNSFAGMLLLSRPFAAVAWFMVLMGSMFVGLSATMEMSVVLHVNLSVVVELACAWSPGRGGAEPHQRQERHGRRKLPAWAPQEGSTPSLHATLYFKAS